MSWAMDSERHPSSGRGLRQTQGAEPQDVEFIAPVCFKAFPKT